MSPSPRQPDAGTLRVDDDRRLNPARWGFGGWLVLTLGAGIIVCAVIAALTRGDPYDMGSLRLVRDALDHGAFDVYSSFAHRALDRYPYPPGFFPWVYLSGWVSAHGGPSFEFMIRVPTILADAAIAWLVQDFLGWRGADQRTRLAAAALVSLGPSFVIIAGYHGQIDALAILPAVLALNIWCRNADGSRALACGLLIGLGAVIKTVPLLLILALLPTSRNKREGAVLIGAAIVPLVLAFVPFALSNGLPSLRLLEYRGRPGLGGLSLVIQPDLAKIWLGIAFPNLTSATKFLMDHGSILVLASVALVAFLGVRRRPKISALHLSVMLWLAVYAFGGNFFFQYLVWGLPFFLMAGYIRAVAVAELVLLPPTLLNYLAPWHHSILAVGYAAVMIVLWGWSTVAFSHLTIKLARARSAVAAAT